MYFHPCSDIREIIFMELFEIAYDADYYIYLINNNTYIKRINIR